METADAIKAIKRFGDAATRIADAIRKLFGPVLKVLTFSPANEAIASATALCAQISKGRLDVVYGARLFSKYRVKAHKKYSFAEDSLPSPTEVASTLAVTIRALGTRHADVQLIIPKLWVAMKAASLPAAASENLPEVVRFEFDRLTPFNADEALYDYLIGKESVEKIDLFIAAAKAGTITDYSQSLTERGIAVKSVTFDISCLATLCSFSTGYPSFIFAEIDRCGIKSGMVDSGIMQSSTSQEFRCDDNVLMAVIIEDFIGGQKGSNSSADKELPVILFFQKEADSLRESLKARGNLSFETLNNLEQKIAGVRGYELTESVLVGGMLEMLWPKARRFNLLAKGVQDRDRKPFFLTILLAVAMAACLAAYILVPIQTETERLEEINRQINMRKAEVQNVEQIKSEIEAINKRLTLINNFRHDKPLYIDLLKEFTTVIPKNVWLTRVRIAGTQANIEGYAQSATSLVQILEASKYFEKVEFASPTFRDARLNMDRFQFKMEIKGSKTEGAVNEKK
ncbi:MAG: PilN domain-containing protein [Dissulfurispiraceae bacterium]|jgi:Tfp pilus assembly protein PilN